MKKFLLFFMAPVLLAGCYMGPQGELVGVQPREYWDQANPYGMNYIHFGSYTMGPSDQDVPYALNTRSKTVTIPAFYMDIHEISNNEYRQFVNWVRDSIARIILGEMGVPGYELIEEDDYGNYIDPPRINWNRPIRWDNAEVREVLESEMYLPGHERFYSKPNLQ